MKTAGIVRIIAGTLAAIFFTYVLVTVLSGSVIFGINTGELMMGIHVNGDSIGNPATTASRGQVTEQVTQIEIHWTAGKVYLQAGTGDAITFEEAARTTLSASQMMQYTLKNGKLKIDYCANPMQFLGALNKELTVTIPAGVMTEGLNKIMVDTTSADVYAKDIRAEKIQLGSTSGRIEADGMRSRALDAETISGRIQLKGIDTEVIELESTSGEIRMEGKAREVETDCTSGGITLTMSQVPQKLDVETTSGSIDLAVPDTVDGFSVRVDSVSGGFRCDFPMLQNGNRFTVNGGVGAFSMETVSGGIRITKLG